MNTNYGALMKMLRVVDSKEGGNVNDIWSEYTYKKKTSFYVWGFQ